MDPSDLLPGLAGMLEKRFGRTGYHMGSVVAVMAALTIILSPIVPGAALFALFKWAFDPAYLPRLFYLAVVFGVLLLPLSVLSFVIMTRMVQPRLYRKLEEGEHQLDEDRRNFAEHRRKHRENPDWHIVVRTPDDAHAQREEILQVLSRYVDEAVAEGEARVQLEEGQNG